MQSIVNSVIRLRDWVFFPGALNPCVCIHTHIHTNTHMKHTHTYKGQFTCKKKCCINWNVLDLLQGSFRSRGTFISARCLQCLAVSFFWMRGSCGLFWRLLISIILLARNEWQAKKGARVRAFRVRNLLYQVCWICKSCMYYRTPQPQSQCP